MPALSQNVVDSQHAELPAFRVVYRSEKEPQCCVGVRFDGAQQEVGLYRGKIARLARDRILDPSLWFILPPELTDSVLAVAQELQRRKEDAMEQGYREIAADVEAEAEALEWCEAMIGDGFESEEE